MYPGSGGLPRVALRNQNCTCLKARKTIAEVDYVTPSHHKQARWVISILRGGVAWRLVLGNETELRCQKQT